MIGQTETLELHQLRSFLAVAEEGHFTRAAERLYLSQPAVSAHVKALEARLGLELFARTPKGVQLTDAGRAIRDEARKVLAGVGNLLAQARALRGELGGGVRLGLNTDPVFLRVPRFLTGMRAAYPKLEFQLIQGLSGVVLSDIKSGKLDAGFVFMQPESTRVSHVTLGTSRLRVVAPTAWAERIQGLDWKGLTALPWILTPPACPFRRVANRMFAQAGAKPAQVVVADLEAIVRALVTEGDGLGLLREDAALEAARAGDVAVWDGEAVTLELSFAFLRTREQDPLIRAMVHELLDVWRP
ncbi:MAG: LysR family transcriptional regulator [Desulfovibrionaceae bacterium]